MKKRFLITLLLALLLLFSCNFNEVKEPSASNDGTWKGLFNAYWQGMNQNYVFWDLDSPGKEWDAIHSAYEGRFEALGSVDETDTATVKKAVRYFYDISSMLSDGHYSLTFKDWSISSSSIRLAKEYDPSLTDDALFESLWSDKYLKLKTLYPQSEFAEDYGAIIGNTFGLQSYKEYSGAIYSWDLPEPKGTDSFDILNGYFSEWVVFPSSSGIITVPGVLMGLTKENVAEGIPANCLYFLIEQFAITVSKTTGEEIAKRFNDYLHREGGLSGLVFDVRGNPGGAAMDLEKLFSMISKDDIPFLRYRAKEGDNRLDYSQWFPNTINSNLASGESESCIVNKPIAIITNKKSVSCSEMTTLFFKRFAKTRTVGNTTCGAQGVISEDSSSVYGGGGFNIGGKLSVYMPFLENEDINGVSYEGKGIPADIPVPFNYTDFSAGTDARLKAAFNYINDSQ